MELILKQPDKILRVGDELPDFRQDIRWDISSKPISSTRKFTGSRRGLMYKIEESTRKGQAIIYIEDATVDKRSFTPYIRFLKKGAQIELKNGTRYICASPGGCEVINFVVAEGEIEVYHNQNGK